MRRRSARHPRPGRHKCSSACDADAAIDEIMRIPRNSTVSEWFLRARQTTIAFPMCSVTPAMAARPTAGLSDICEFTCAARCGQASALKAPSHT